MDVTAIGTDFDSVGATLIAGVMKGLEPLAKIVMKQKEVFLSATYKDQKDCIEEVKSKLAELGVKAH